MALHARLSHEDNCLRPDNRGELFSEIDNHE
jgi:hypothetical protein